MNSCMIEHATQKEQDAAREEWFAGMELRRSESLKQENQKREQEAFYREWWNLPQSSDNLQEDKAPDPKS